MVQFEGVSILVVTLAKLGLLGISVSEFCLDLMTDETRQIRKDITLYHKTISNKKYLQQEVSLFLDCGTR